MSDPDLLRGRLVEAWRRSDAIFDLVPTELITEQPIELRHPILFYVGHLPAFAWNQVMYGMFGERSHRPELDDLFERGIDPVGVDRHEPQVDWPTLEEVLGYRDRVRETLLGAVDRVAERAPHDRLADRGRIFSVVLEHELMHQETLLYMLQQMPPEQKQRPEAMPGYALGGGGPEGRVRIGGGEVRLGADIDQVEFGWDNEFPPLDVRVDGFEIDRTPVRNGAFLEFVGAGGYRRPELWWEDDWRWRERQGIEHPAVWELDDGTWRYRTMFDRLPLESVLDWPVFVSRAEASAFCRWRGGRLPTEAELQRAGYTTPDGGSRPYPWGDAPPGPEHGNFDLRQWAPMPVGTHTAGDSGWGVADLVGDGWEWTETPFRPFPGFEPYIRSYPGYSADFFDDLHQVILGASWATPAGLIRRTFRNWFQGHYPYVFATFRVVGG